MTNPVVGPAGWKPPEPAARPELAHAFGEDQQSGVGGAGVPRLTPPAEPATAWAPLPVSAPTPPPAVAQSAPPFVSPGSTGQVYASSYLSPQRSEPYSSPPVISAPASTPQQRPSYQPIAVQPAAAEPFEGYGSYEPGPYDPRAQSYETSPGYAGFPDSGMVEGGGAGGLDPLYGAQYDQQLYDQQFYGQQQNYAQQNYGDPYPPPVAGSGSNARDDDDDSLRQRLARLPKTAVLASACVVLLLACLTLVAMYVGSTGKAGENADELRQAQADVKQRDTKIEGLNTALTDAEQQLGSGTDQLTTSQTELQKLTADMEKAKKDLETSNKDKTELAKDKESLTSCLKALMAASGERDPAKQAQLAQQSQQTCARGFELAGIQTG